MNETASAKSAAIAPTLVLLLEGKSQPHPLDLGGVDGVVDASDVVIDPASATPSIAPTAGQSGMQISAVVLDAHESGPRTVAKWSSGANVTPSSSDAPTMKPLDSTEHA